MRSNNLSSTPSSLPFGSSPVGQIAGCAGSVLLPSFGESFSFNNRLIVRLVQVPLLSLLSLLPSTGNAIFERAEIIFLQFIDVGSFWLDVLGQEINAAMQSFSAIVSVELGENLNTLNASFCRSPKLKGVGALSVAF